GGIWVDYEKDNKTGGLVLGSPKNQVTNIPGLYAIGEADYQYHGANRLGANSLLSCIFSGLLVAPGIEKLFKGIKKPAGDLPSGIFDSAIRHHKDNHDKLVARTGKENAYLLHQELGR